MDIFVQQKNEKLFNGTNKKIYFDRITELIE